MADKRPRPGSCSGCRSLCASLDHLPLNQGARSGGSRRLLADQALGGRIQRRAGPMRFDVHHLRVLTENGTSGEHSSAHACESCASSICVILGIVIHVVGSVGINIGQNIQAMALDALGDQQHKPWKSKLWVIGMATFAVSSIVTFGALALASASILVPLESVQFVVNIAFNKIIRKKSITPKMYAGVVMIMAGIALFVIFGPNEGVCFAEPELRGFWTSPTWWVYMIVTFAIALVAYIVWRRYNFATRQGKPMAYANVVEPAAFTLSSALFGGGQMIVHTKLLAELLELNAAAGELALANWFFWLELFLTALFGIYWLFRLSQCLGMYAPLTLIILSAAHGHRPPAWACSLTTRRVPRVPQVRPPLYHSSHADCLHHLRRHRWWHLLSGIRSHGRGSLLRALYAAHARTARVRPTRTCPFASPSPPPVATFLVSLNCSSSLCDRMRHPTQTRWASYSLSVASACLPRACRRQMCPTRSRLASTVPRSSQRSSSPPRRPQKIRRRASMATPSERERAERAHTN